MAEHKTTDQGSVSVREYYEPHRLVRFWGPFQKQGPRPEIDFTPENAIAFANDIIEQAQAVLASRKLHRVTAAGTVVACVMAFDREDAIRQVKLVAEELGTIVITCGESTCTGGEVRLEVE